MEKFFLGTFSLMIVGGSFYLALIDKDIRSVWGQVLTYIVAGATGAATPGGVGKLLEKSKLSGNGGATEKDLTDNTASNVENTASNSAVQAETAQLRQDVNQLANLLRPSAVNFPLQAPAPTEREQGPLEK